MNIKINKKKSDIFDEIELLDETQLKNKEEKLLKNQIKYVLRYSDFYKKKWQDYGQKLEDIFCNFKNLPFTKKDEIISLQNKETIYNSNLCISKNKIVRIQKTSGTTTTPLFIPLTKNDIKYITDCGARCFWAAGLRPGDVVVNCMNYCMYMGGFTDHQSLEKTGACVIPFGVGSTELLIETILKTGIDTLHSTPSYLSKLEQVLSEKYNLIPKDLKLKRGLFGGESFFQNEKYRRELDEKWGFEAFNANYGIAEIMSMFGGECIQKDGLHFMGQGHLLVELYSNEKEKYVEIEKGNIGEFILSNLKKEANPLIKYKTGDIVKIIDTSKCACGRTSFRFQIIGRADDMIIIKGVNLFPNSIKNIIANYPKFFSGDFRIILYGKPPYNYIKLLVEMSEVFDTKINPEQIKEKLKTELKNKLNITFDIDLIEKNKLIKTDGKIKYIIYK
ncbi:MAG TPA: AMP-binding protein [bacterium]|nr:AMP-binding protein [bacterium]